ncbi:NAD+ synthase [Halalkalibaculum sp. DA3122]|uniref:NAD+ synthase n=1 Tax=unclassified Halalkalibaculum TaxID=2964617 RepID=UPI003754017A
MKIRLQQLNQTIGDLEQNVRSILQALEEAVSDGIDLLVLPEMTVCGYPPMDLLERAAFRNSVYAANERIIKATTVSTALVFGSITPNRGLRFGRQCCNTALVARNGKKLAQVHKTLLPTYDVFDELRYFEPNDHFECIEIDGIRLGITICEDIWYNENDIQYHTYRLNPAEELAERGAQAIINISASPFTKTKPQSRQRMLQDHARNLQRPLFYCNQVGANTELVFDGDSMAVDSQANMVARAPLFEECYVDTAWDVENDSLVNIGQPPAEIPEKSEGVFKGLSLGLKDYLRKTGIAEKVILGLSGGIDSTLVACIAAEALKPGNVIGITMPSEFSSEGSISDSERLAENLGIGFHQLAIKDIYEQYEDTLEPLFRGTSFGVAEENLQSRIRGMLLMAVANKFGYMLLNTGNKSEMATGYCTLYGDMNGGLGVLNDLYKTEVYDMARWLNEHYYGRNVIPQSVIDKPPTAELRPGQKDSDSLPPYEVLDPILYSYIEKQESAERIAEQGFDYDLVKRLIKMVDNNEFKRFQATPGLKVSPKAFGSGRRWPIVQQWTKHQ